MTTMTIDVVYDAKNAVLLYVRSNQTTLLTINLNCIISIHSTNGNDTHNDNRWRTLSMTYISTVYNTDNLSMYGMTKGETNDRSEIGIPVLHLNRHLEHNINHNCPVSKKEWTRCSNKTYSLSVFTTSVTFIFQRYLSIK